jgi:threonine dehydrogenase-like Zn-dependent dehydrogenase
MKALVYEGPRQMVIRDVPVPSLQPDEILVRVTYSGICGSELSGFEGKNSLRKPPLIMGHEFSGKIESIGSVARQSYPAYSLGQPVTVNPLIVCGHCAYCTRDRSNLCANRRLMSASLPGSNAQFVAVRADAVYPLPGDMPLTTSALAEPAACAIHLAQIVPPAETALVVGAGPIGLLTIQALHLRGFNTIYCADLNPERLAMAEMLGALPVQLSDNFRQRVDVTVDAVGTRATRKACQDAIRTGGSIIWVGLHDQFAELDVNDMVRREISCYGSFGYTPANFVQALDLLHHRQIRLEAAWTRIEPLENGPACFEELLHGSSVAKIWLMPWSTNWSNG